MSSEQSNEGMSVPTSQLSEVSSLSYDNSTDDPDYDPGEDINDQCNFDLGSSFGSYFSKRTFLIP